MRPQYLAAVLACMLIATHVGSAAARTLSETQPAAKSATPAAAAKDTKQASTSNNPEFRQIPAQVFLPERVFFNPNNGEDNKVEDYIANVYFGEVDVAEADPVLAAAGAGAAAGIQFTYDKSTYFDYEAPLSSANFGPGAKAIAAGVARVLGLGSAKALGRVQVKTNGAYSRNAYDGNSVAVGTLTELAGGASAGAYLDRTSGNDNEALLAQPPVPTFLFGP